jgi:hypothetical protein
MRRVVFLILTVVTTSCVATPATISTSTTEPPPTTTSAPPTTTTTTTTPAGEILAQVDDLIAETEAVRDLRFMSKPDVTVVDDQELADRVRQMITENVDADQISRDAALEELLGLIPEGTDLLSLYQELYSEQVLGFYDGETKELVVPANGAELSAAQKVTLVHELTHALTDQHFSFSELSDRLDEEQRYDELSALQTITEGDATLTELHYAAGLPADQQRAVITESLGQDTGVFDTAPVFIQDLLVFPYNAGLALLSSLWSSEDGYARIDDAYTDPPTTTEQVMHADKFKSREPALDVTLPGTPVDGYESVEESVWGELLFHVMFSQELGGQEADIAAGGWGGDRYRLLWNGTDVVFVLRYEGDTEQDAEEMESALNDYVTVAMEPTSSTADGQGVRFTGQTYAFVSRDGDQVVFIAAAERTAGQEARTAFPEF